MLSPVRVPNNIGSNDDVATTTTTTIPLLSPTPATPRSSSIPDYKPPVQNTSTSGHPNLADRRAGQLCSTEAPVVRRATSVAECARRMRENGADCVLVEENGTLCGIFTDNDMVRKVVSAKKDPLTTAVEQVMSSKVFTIPPDCGILQAVLIMMDNKFRHMPVVKDGATFGLLYMHHCIAAVLSQLRTTCLLYTSPSPRDRG